MPRSAAQAGKAPGESLPRGRQRSLDRGAIAQAALALIDREGLAALSMRRLAAELDVGTMSLYRYFRDKDELLDAIVDASARRAGSQLALSGSWQDRLRALMRALRQNLERHPGLVQIRLQRPMLSPAALRLAEEVMRILEGAGIPKASAARAYRTLFLYTSRARASTPAATRRRSSDSRRARWSRCRPRSTR
jgi:AcrR family transcriptional regulator